MALPSSIGGEFMARRRSKPQKIRVLVLGAALALLGGALFQPATASARGDDSELNHPEHYEQMGYGHCSKDDHPGHGYDLGAPPPDEHWSLLVLKSGSEHSNDDWNTMVEYPAMGSYVHPSGKDLSHTIKCHDHGGGGHGGGCHGGGHHGGGCGTTTTTTPGGPCDDYTPTQVTVDPVTVMAGNTVTVAGVALPGDTVTATLSPPPVPLGSDVADGSGQFSITGTIPVGTPPDSYDIIVESQGCPASTIATVTVVGTVFSGCGYNSSDRTFEQGQSVAWSLHVPSFSTSHPVTLRLKRSGYDQVLYSGAWPPSDEANIAIPATAPTGKYWIHQIGTKKNGKGSKTKKCPVWVILDFSNVVDAAAVSGPVDDGEVPPQLLLGLGVIAVGGYSLVRLGGRRARSLARA